MAALFWGLNNGFFSSFFSSFTSSPPLSVPPLPATSSRLSPLPAFSSVTGARRTETGLGGTAGSGGVEGADKHSSGILLRDELEKQNTSI